MTGHRRRSPPGEPTQGGDVRARGRTIRRGTRTATPNQAHDPAISISPTHDACFRRRPDSRPQPGSARRVSGRIMYRLYASMVQGPYRQELRVFFASQIPEELAHAQILADNISVTIGAR